MFNPIKKKSRKEKLEELIKEYMGHDVLITPGKIIWKMIDEENQKEDPDCYKIDLLLEILERFNEEAEAQMKGKFVPWNAGWSVGKNVLCPGCRKKARAKG